MQKREPIIIAPDYTDDEFYEWILAASVSLLADVRPF